MNFILRTITQREGGEERPMINNQFLGAHYQVVRREGDLLKEWHRKLRKYYPDMEEKYAELYTGYIVYSNCILLEKQRNYYIMTESGQTFEKI